jgi:hypothetical protein
MSLADEQAGEEAVRITGTIVSMGSGEVLEVIFTLREVSRISFSFFFLAVSFLFVLCSFSLINTPTLTNLRLRK